MIINTMLNNSSVETCQECGSHYEAYRSYDECPECNCKQPNCRACDNKNCAFCEDGSEFKEKKDDNY